MTPNATVSYMAAQAERQLVDAKAARAWIVDEPARDRAPGSDLIRLPMQLLGKLAVRISGHHRTAKTTQSIPNPALGMFDPVR